MKKPIHWEGLKSQYRLKVWKNIRTHCENLSDINKLEFVADLFYCISPQDRAIDLIYSNSWPSPWEILYYGIFCKSSLSILVYYTLMFIGIDQSRLQLLLLENVEFIVCMVDDKYILNYFPDEYCLIDDLDFPIKQYFDNNNINQY